MGIFPELDKLYNRQHDKELAMDYDKGITATVKVVDSKGENLAEPKATDMLIIITPMWDNNTVLFVPAQVLRDHLELAIIAAKYMDWSPGDPVEGDTDMELYNGAYGVYDDIWPDPPPVLLSGIIDLSKETENPLQIRIPNTGNNLVLTTICPDW